MRFRFTLSYSIESLIEAPDVEELPELNDWLNNTEINRVAWNLGAAPSVSLNNEVSEILYADYDFVDGVEYSITCTWAKSAVGSDVPPRFIRLSIYNDSFVSQFSDSDGNFNSSTTSGSFTLTFTATASCKKVGIQTQFGGQATITISNVTLGLEQAQDQIVTNTDSLVINEPSGWEDAVLKLERDEKFHSLIEHFEGEFIFYGDNGIQNGGIDFIKNVEATYGPDADLNILIEISFDGYEYEEVFRGLLDLSTIQEFPDNTLQCAIIRNDFWTKFITRQETQVNLQNPLSVDDENVTVHDSVNLSMTPQVLRARFLGRWSESIQIGPMLGTSADFGIIDFDLIEFDEIPQKFNYPVTFTGERPFELFAMEYAGEYQFDVRVCLSYVRDDQSDSRATDSLFDVKIQVNNDTATSLTATNRNLGGGYNVTDYTIQTTLSLNKGDFVYLYIEGNGDDGAYTLWLLGDENGLLTPTELISDENETTLSVIGDTISPSSNAEGFLLGDAAAHICDRIIGQDDSFYSEFLFSPLTSIIVPDYGCAWFYMILKGLQIRQYSLLEKPFFLSFRQWWDGANPILNLGLGYETIDSITQDLLLNDQFDDSSAWANEGTGEDWTVGSGEATVTVTTTSRSSKELTQTIADTVAGEYTMAGNYNMDGIVFGSKRAKLTIVVVDSQGTETIIEALSPINDVTPSSGHPDFNATFNSSYPIVAIFAVIDVIQGTGPHNIVLNYLTLSGPVGGSEVIRVEEKEHFYDGSETSVDFSNCQITRMYDNDLFFNNIEIGYKKWESENASGINDPQTKRTYSTRFKKIGRKITLHSDFIAAGLTIETTRRTTREKSADYKYDNDTFIIAVNPVPVDISPETSPDVVDFEPELDENFTSITGLLNEDSRYNLRLTPARNLLRWLNYLSGCLQNYVSSVFKFSSGEGNYDMESTLTDTSPDCSDRADFAGDELGESANIPVTEDYLFIPVPIEITIPVEWEEYKLIRENRKKAIGISQTTSNHAKFFVKLIEYKVAKGEATMTLWPKDPFALQVITDIPSMRTCVPVSESECAMIEEDSEQMLNEAGDLMILESC